MANWSELLPELLLEIAENLIFYEDFISFTNVCKSWESATQPIRSSFTGPSRFPSLMLAEDDEQDESIFRRFYLISKKNHIRKTRLPEASKKQCFSSRGWLFTVAADNFTEVKLVDPDTFEKVKLVEVKLVDPFTRLQIDLPRLDTIPNYDYHCECLGFPSIVRKVMISSQPYSFDLLDLFVFVLYGDRTQLAFCKPGHDSWTIANKEWESPFYDLTYHNRKVYLVDYGCRIVVCHIQGLKLTPFVQIAAHPSQFNIADGMNDTEWLYVLGDRDKLLLVSREGFELAEEEYEKEDPHYSTKRFRVFELNLDDCKWTKLDTLGERAVFVGFNSAFCTLASEDGIIIADCIYFTDDLMEIYWGNPKGGGKDMGIYRLCDGSIEPHFNHESRSVLTPPTWIEPSF